jgi:hypothetical protein
MRHSHSLVSRIRRALGPKVGPIGVEFRDGFVRMVQVAMDRRAHVVGAACVAYDPQAPDRAMEHIAHALLGGHFHGRDCVVVLPFEAARVETMTVPEGDDLAIRGDVARSLAQGNTPEHCEFDFMRLGSIGRARCEITAVTADRTLIEAIVHPLIDAGFWPGAVEPSFSAVARACSRTHRRAADRGRVRMALDLHAGGMTAMLLQGQTIVYANSVRGRSQVVEALTACWAESLRVFSIDSPSEVRLVGSDAYNVELHQQIERACGIPVRLDDDAGSFASAYAEIGINATDGCGAAAWMGALGAAFRGLSRAELRRRSHAAAESSSIATAPDQATEAHRREAA